MDIITQGADTGRAMGATEGKPLGSVEQWAASVINFSSQYDNRGWGANAVLGPPKVYPQYGDIRGAWAQGTCDANQFIEVGFDTAVFVSAINIYETLNSGGVKKVLVQNTQGGWDTVWETAKPQQFTQSRIFSPEIKTPSYRTKGVRLDVDCSAAGTWVEIDAVQLVGRKLRIEQNTHPLKLLSDDLSSLVNDKDSSDVTLRVDDQVLYAHKAILRTRSVYFKDLLTGTLKDEVVRVPGFSFRGLHGVLHYIYTGSLPQDWGPCSVVDVWRVDTKVKVGGLQDYCATVIDGKLDCDNVVSVFVSASETSPVSEVIREICLDFMASNLSTVSRSPEFKALSKNLMLEIVQLATEKMSIK